MVTKGKNTNDAPLKEYEDLTKELTTGLKEDKSIIETGTINGEYVLLFFSFDIVNSAQYKTISNLGWATFINGILGALRHEVNGKIKDAEVWRIFGDEVVFVVKIRDKDALFEYIEKIYDILIRYCEDIETGDFNNIIDMSIQEAKEILSARGVVSLQASAWIAIVIDKEELDTTKDLYVENIFEVIEDNPENRFYEFIGVDIDAGFRISKFTRARRLVLSFELARLLSDNTIYAKRMHIVTYQKLKGVWNGNTYPIIWYYDETKNLRNGNYISFNESIPFDASEKDEIYKDLINKKKPFDKYLYKDANKALSKIEIDRCLTWKIERINSKIASENQNDGSMLFKKTKLELHCVAVCISNEGKILIVKRSDREPYPGKWEFGCAKANSKEDIISTIKYEYKKDFGVNINLVTDKTRKDEQPVPFALYSIPKGTELHKGIIFLAYLEDTDITLNDQKHVENEFISEEDLSRFNDDDFVPDGLNTLKKAFEYWNNREVDNNGQN